MHFYKFAINKKSKNDAYTFRTAPVPKRLGPLADDDNGTLTRKKTAAPIFRDTGTSPLQLYSTSDVKKRSKYGKIACRMMMMMVVVVTEKPSDLGALLLL